jgi:hypothetical protein
VSQRVRGTHVNIVDLIKWGRRGDERHNVRIFKSRGDLAEYTERENKIFAKALVVDDEGDMNIVETCASSHGGTRCQISKAPELTSGEIILGRPFLLL